MRRAPNSTIFVVMILCASVFGGAINFMAYSRIADGRQNLASVQAEVDAAAKVPARLEDSKLKLHAAEAALHHLEQGVTASTYVPTLMRQLEDLGKSCGVAVTAVKPVPSIAPSTPSDIKDLAAKPYDTLDIEIRGLARYVDAQRFLAALDSFPKVVEARTVALEPVARSDQKVAVGSPKLSLSILLRTYLFKSDNRTVLLSTETKNAG